MTEIELAGYLGIEQDISEKIEKIDEVYEIRDAKIGEIDSELWNQNVELRFFNCEFQETINLQNKTIHLQLFCSDCLFQGLFLARNNFSKLIGFSCL